MCVYCDQVCSDWAEFRNHMELEHRTFWLPAAFSHVMPESYLKVDITDLKCRICCLCFNTLDDVAKHLNDCHIHKIDMDHQFGLHPFKFSEDRMCCVLCENIFSCVRSLSRHMLTHYTNYICEECGRKFSTGASLYHHTRNAHKLGLYGCRKCKGKFKSALERRQHLLSSEKCWLYKCSYCPKRLLNYTLKQNHQAEEHGEQRNVHHQCLECGLVFKSRKSYGTHFTVVHSGVRFECLVCGRPFNTKNDLKRHEFTHSKNKDQHCAVCPKSFTRKEYLKQHMKVHSGKK